MRALLIEDDPMIGDSLQRLLQGDGMSIDWVKTGEDGLHAVKTGAYAFILLDLGLPDQGGLKVVKEIRANQNDTPVIIITANDAVENRIGGLDLGADDFLVKPFDSGELMARIRAVLRRRSGNATSTLSNGLLTLDISTHEASYKGKIEVLSAREFSLLHTLVERTGTIFSRQQLEERVYGWGEEVESNAVDVLIYYIRKKFDASIIKNVRGVGWMAPKAKV